MEQEQSKHRGQKQGPVTGQAWGFSRNCPRLATTAVSLDEMTLCGETLEVGGTEGTVCVCAGLHVHLGTQSSQPPCTSLTCSSRHSCRCAPFIATCIQSCSTRQNPHPVLGILSTTTFVKACSHHSRQGMVSVHTEGLLFVARNISPPPSPDSK